MLYIVKKKPLREIQARVGSIFPEVDWEDVREIQADGHELTKLQLMFPSLPRVNKPVVRYVGQDAQFIAANLSGRDDWNRA